MPLVIIVGLPCTGKSELARKLRAACVERSKTIEIVTDSDFTDSVNDVYSSSKGEKILRGQLKSAVQRLLNKDTLVILDSLNYIKGCRYELYCISKDKRTTHCVVECSLKFERSREINQQRDKQNQWSGEIMDALKERYEQPDPSKRWDSPYFLCTDEEINIEPILEAIYNRKPPPPNQSTQSQPLSEGDFLFELDQRTTKIIVHILQAQKMSAGLTISIPGESQPIQLTRPVTMVELKRWKRAFITYSKSHPPSEKTLINATFIQYLNSVCTEV